MRWRLLVVLVGAFVVVPVVVSITAGGNLLPLAIAGALILLVGAGGAGLRARGSAYQTPHQDFPEREGNRQIERGPQGFKKPPNEGGLL